MALDVGTLVGYLKLDDSNWNKNLDQAEGKANTFGSNTGAMFGKIAGIAAGVFASIQIGQFFQDGINYVSDLNETLNKSSTIFGDQAGAMEAWASNAATTMGLSKQAALDAAAGFGDMFSQIGFTGDAAASMSQQVVQAAADLGSFSNLDTADVSERIAAAFRGEYDSLQAVIPNINAARVESEAMAMTGKKNADQLTAQEKAAAVLAIVHKDGARAMGDFAKTSDGYANSSKIVAAQMEELGGKVGALLLPVMKDLQGFLLDRLIPAFEDTVENVRGFIEFVQNNFNWIGPLVAGLALIAAGVTGVGLAMQIQAAGGLVAYVTAMFPAIASTWGFTAALLANPVTWIVVGIMALIGAIILLAANWDTVTAWVSDVWAGFTGWMSDSFGELSRWWNELWTGIGQAINDIWTGIVNWFTDAVTNVVNWVKDYWGLLLSFFIGPLGLVIQWVVEHWSEIVKFFSDTITNIGNFFTSGFNAIGSFLTDVWKNISNGITNWWSNIIAFFRDLPSNIIGFFSGVGQWLFDAGKNLIQGLFDGIQSLAGNIARFFLDILPGWMVDPFKAALGIHSPSKVFTEFGENIGEGVMAGLETLQPEIDTHMRGIVTVPALPDSARGKLVNMSTNTNNRNFTYVAAPGSSISAEEDLFSALGRARAVAF